MQLRDYQRDGVDALFDYFGENEGNPLLVLPTASGKSIMQAAFIREALEGFPGERILCLTHVKELLGQNEKAIRDYWPAADIGVYSAGMGRRELGYRVTIAGIQSVFRKAHLLGPISIVMIDECHLVPKRSQGMYHKFLTDLRTINPHVKIVGMSATPYRLGSGLLHMGEGAIFTDIAYSADIVQLVKDGWLCNLRSQVGEESADLSGARIRGGEFLASDVGEIMGDDSLVSASADEICKLLANRNKWLVFCSGVDHANTVREALIARGIETKTITGATPKAERDEMLADFKAGKFRAITNVNVLTTGFDAPDIDAIIMLRPTMSTALYVQMVGRGMRIHPSKQDTQVLDFAGNIRRHGPLPKIKVHTGSGEIEISTTRPCPECREENALDELVCVECGYVFPEPEEKPPEPNHDMKPGKFNIMDANPIELLDVDAVYYRLHKKVGKPDSLRVDYQCGLLRYSEWICLEHGGFAQRKACDWWLRRSDHAVPATVSAALEETHSLLQPESIRVNTDGQFNKIIGYIELCPPTDRKQRRLDLMAMMR